MIRAEIEGPEFAPLVSERAVGDDGISKSGVAQHRASSDLTGNFEF
jgi:hypothetical protein